jgi:hypothetical protein
MLRARYSPLSRVTPFSHPRALLLFALAAVCLLLVRHASVPWWDAAVVGYRTYIARECDLLWAPELPVLQPFPRYVRAPAVEGVAQRVDFVWVAVTFESARDSLSSVCHFYKSPTTMHVIVPDKDAPAAARVARGACGAAAIRVRVWSEGDVVPAFRAPGASQRFPGTLRQMLLKLAAATECVGANGAAWYVVMDADVYARRPFSVGDLLASRGGAAPRARTDFDYPAHAQPKRWSTEAGALLGTRVAVDTHAWCAAQQPAFSSRAPIAVDAARPFALTAGPRGQSVYGACFDARGGGTHVTPMILSVELVAHVLAPRLRARAEAAARAGSAAAAAAGAPWYAAALAFHAEREAYCAERGFDVARHRFYSWTEYSLYFVAAVAAQALDDFHDFRAGALLSFPHSAFDPTQYEAWDADAVLDDARDAAPFFLVHSWFQGGGNDAVHALLVKRGVVQESR